MARQDELNEILQLLTQNGYTITDRDEFGVYLISKDESHKVQLQQTTLTFNHPIHQIDWRYCMGATLGNLRPFLRHLPNFKGEMPAELQKMEKVAKPQKKPAYVPPTPINGPSSTATPTAAPSTTVPVTAPTEKGPSCRRTIFELLEKNTPREVILEQLVTMFPSRDRKSLRGQLALNYGQFQAGTRLK